MACCGIGTRAASNVAYEVKTNDGKTTTVASIPEARILIAQAGGGTYKAVPKKP
ncbi:MULTISPECIES: hypothetical protein [unclassified Streptomyces]|uniref:hypothetical protein n=1 Tax=unclassified Streptomyces TaxID=2593676 RepID=UPI00081E82BB|nr:MULTISPECIES: hypothetical protein [unclassified Streptomyces]MYZ35862.1 hypothetical protein [Streptomyces sp. SID4917]SCF78904.1 hypothetical protein GA0115259_1025518 [Streptomyces sp. MnatMP-M17]